jgi:hypothetical protein
VTTPTITEQADETAYPATWKFDEHGDLVAGTFLRFDEGQTKDYGARVIMVLLVDGQERSVWLSQMALFSKVRDELNRRTSKTLEPGERVVVQRHEKTTSENGRSYWPFAVSFPDRPQKSTTDLFELDERHVKYDKKPSEPAPGDVDSDGDVPF